MSDVSQRPGWWQASNGKWYPPQTPAAPLAPPPPEAPNDWWSNIAPATIGGNVRYLNVRTPTKSMGMGTLKVTEEGLRWRANLGPKVLMEWPKIQAVDIEGETTRRVTAGRVVTMGVFALGAKKQRRETHLTVVTDDAEYGFLFEKVSPEVVRTKLRPVLDALVASQRQPDPVVAAAPSVAAPTGDGLAEETGRLASLHASGALSDSEFAAAKAKLIGS